jgi:hypothetical protein
MAPAAQESALQPYPLYDTTFTLHRVSPLYTGLNHVLDNPTLQQHARRFRDILAGDVLRGVRVGLGPEDDVLARVGALQFVTWQVLVEEDFWNIDDDTKMDTTIGVGAEKGILVQVSYEKMEYRAILLCGDGGGSEADWKVGEGFEHFPLLLTRMPGSLRETFMGFLATTFDANISVLRLSGQRLTKSFEKYIFDCCTGEDGEALDLVESSRTLRKVIKDVRVLVGFDFPDGNSSLQTVEFSIEQEDIPRLVQKGKKIGNKESPFINALSSFVKAHLALDMGHESVSVLRIACGPFVLGSEGRVKFTAPSSMDGKNVQRRATWSLVDGIVGIARGGKLSVGKDVP